MKKYKLIKLYPGSPKLGTEVNYSETHQIYNYNGGNFYTELPKHQVENLPEFWEKVKEVKEKEYEILECYQETTLTRSKYYYTKISTGRNWENVLYCAEKNLYPISKIVRMCDGEIFSLGDKLVLDKYMGERKYITIDKIYYNEHNQLSFKTNIKPAPCTFVFGLFDIGCKKYKQSLFITEDKVEIYNKDRYWYVVISDRGLIPHAWEPLNDICNWDNSDIPPLGKYQFSTKEAVEKWIDENKPKYSLKQAASFIQKFDLEINQYDENSLEDYMKMIRFEYDKA